MSSPNQIISCRKCRCPTSIASSNSTKNPGRPYYRCPNCVFSHWVEETNEGSSASTSTYRVNSPRANAELKSEGQSELTEDTLSEVLKRLPIKDLFRCMCVSKLWCPIILNPRFNNIYRKYWQDHRFIIIRNHRAADGYFRLYSYAKLERMNLLSVSDVKGCTQIVNGFICIDFRSTGRVSLFNLWRGEITQLPDPIPIEDEDGRHKYHLGFESVSGVYKLLKISKNTRCEIQGCSKRLQILTLCSSSSSSSRDRDMSWRMLPADCLNSIAVGYEGLCGSMFFQTRLVSVLVESSLFWVFHGLRKIICFHLREEKFVLVEPPPHGLLTSLPFQFREKYALFNTLTHENDMVIYTLEDIENQVWMKHVFKLGRFCGPYDSFRGCWHLAGNVRPIGSFPTGELIFANRHMRYVDPCIEVHSYNYINSLFTTCVLEKLPTLMYSSSKKHPYAVSCVQPQWCDYAFGDY